MVTIAHLTLWVRWAKNYLDWDIFRYLYFFTKYIALLSLIVNKNEIFIYNMKNISLSFCSILYDILTFWIYIHARKRNGGRTWHWALSFCELFFFLPNLQLNIGKKYLKTAIIYDESLILAIVSRNYSIKPSYIFQLKHEQKVWKYIFNLFHFEVLIQNRNLKFRSLSLFVFYFSWI